MSGSGVLRFDQKEYLISKDDFFSKPAGKNLAHQFINTGSELLQILDISTIVEGDVVYYPDEKIHYVVDSDLIVSEEALRDDFSFEPNE